MNIRAGNSNSGRKIRRRSYVIVLISFLLCGAHPANAASSRDDLKESTRVENVHIRCQLRAGDFHRSSHRPGNMGASGSVRCSPKGPDAVTVRMTMEVWDEIDEEWEVYKRKGFKNPEARNATKSDFTLYKKSASEYQVTFGFYAPCARGKFRVVFAATVLADLSIDSDEKIGKSAWDSCLL